MSAGRPPGPRISIFTTAGLRRPLPAVIFSPGCSTIELGFRKRRIRCRRFPISRSAAIDNRGPGIADHPLIHAAGKNIARRIHEARGSEGVAGNGSQAALQIGFNLFQIGPFQKRNRVKLQAAKLAIPASLLQDIFLFPRRQGVIRISIMKTLRPLGRRVFISMKYNSLTGFLCQILQVRQL